MHCIRDYLDRARYILRSEGAVTLLKRLLKYICSLIFTREIYYVRRNFIADLNETDFLPKTEDFCYRMITSNKEADDWAKQIGFDFREQILHARRRLDAGAIASCTFTQNNLAHIGWIGLDHKSKNSFNPQPYKVNFSEREGCIGGAETAREYRNKGFMAYNWMQLNKHMKQQGICVLIDIAAPENIAVHKVQFKFPSTICAKACYIKLLLWRYWKEVPLPEDFIPPMVNQ